MISFCQRTWLVIFGKLSSLNHIFSSTILKYETVLKRIELSTIQINDLMMNVTSLIVDFLTTHILLPHAVIFHSTSLLIRILHQSKHSAGSSFWYVNDLFRPLSWLMTVSTNQHNIFHHVLSHSRFLENFSEDHPSHNYSKTRHT